MGGEFPCGLPRASDDLSIWCEALGSEWRKHNVVNALLIVICFPAALFFHGCALSVLLLMIFIFFGTLAIVTWNISPAIPIGLAALFIGAGLLQRKLKRRDRIDQGDDRTESSEAESALPGNAPDIVLCPKCRKRFHLPDAPPDEFACTGCGTLMDLSSFKQR